MDPLLRLICPDFYSEEDQEVVEEGRTFCVVCCFVRLAGLIGIVVLIGIMIKRAFF